MIDHSAQGTEVSIASANRVAPDFLVRGLRSWRSAGILLPFMAFFIGLSIFSDPFLHPENLLNILDQQSSILIIATAGTLVLVAGGIDLSVGATYSLAGVVAATEGLKHSTGYAVLAGLIVGLGVGFLNGVVIAVLRINSLIATLAMSFVIGGIGAKVTGGNLIVMTDRPGFGKISQSVFLGTPSSVWLMVLVVIMLGVLLSRTVLGRYFIAAGGNSDAARLAGIRVNQVRIITFVLSGGAAGLAGIIDTSRVLSAQSAQGSALAFTVLAGIVVGGTSIAGGDGSVVRTTLGVLFIALIGNGFDLLGLDPLYQQITLGLILLTAVALDAWSRKRRN